jgi:uncharacterized membrane protein SpoIIM required for sporulation
MFGYYVYNNIGIAFRTFAGGVFAGGGSLLFLCFNAFYLGAVSAHVIGVGFSQPFFSFTSGHSALELTGIVLSAASGVQLGYALFVTKGRTRAASLRAAGKTALPLIAGSAFLLLLAATVEGFWSARGDIAPVVHYAVGATLWLCVAAYLLFAGRAGREQA